MNEMKEYFDSIRAIKYSSIKKDQVYNLTCIEGFKIEVTVVKVLSRDKNKVELRNLEQDIDFTLEKENYKNKWILSKQ